MNSRLKRVIALLLVLCMVFVNPVFMLAEGVDSDEQTKHPSNDSQGFTGWGWRIGLAQCTREEYPNTNPGDLDALAAWVKEYNNKYYTKIADGCAIEIPNVEAKDITTAALGVDGLKYDGGRWQIAKGDVDKVMDAIVLNNSANKNLYNLWLEQSKSTSPFYPVVISIEPVVKSTAWSGSKSVYEYAQMCGANLDAFTTVGHELNPKVKGAKPETGEISNGDTVSAVADYIFSCAGWYNNIQNDKNVLFRLFKGYFSWTCRKTFTTKSRGAGYHQVAWFAASETHQIIGNYIVSIGGGSAVSGNSLSGKYLWHINDKHLPAKPGYQEDGVAIAKGEVENIPAVGFSFKQDEPIKWINAIDRASNVVCTINYKYSYTADTASAGGGYSRERNKILTSGILAGTYTNSISKEALKKSVVDGTSIAGITINSTSVPNGAYKNQFYYSAATECTIELVGSGVPPVVMQNNQVHYAIHGTEEEPKTYKFIQESKAPAAQVRDEAVETSVSNNADYEVTAGIPTTNNVMVTMGGDLWVANLQYRYCVDDYVRTYKLRTKEDYPNYMWYGINSDLKQDSEKEIWQASGPLPNITDPSEYNRAYDGWEGHTSGNSDEKQTEAYRKMADAAKTAFLATLGEITHNNKAKKDYTYDVIVTKATPNGKTLDVTVEGENEVLKETTKKDLIAYYEFLYEACTADITGCNGLSGKGCSYDVVMAQPLSKGNDLDSPASAPVIWMLSFTCSNNDVRPCVSQDYCSGTYHGTCNGPVCASNEHAICTKCGGSGSYTVSGATVTCDAETHSYHKHYAPESPTPEHQDETYTHTWGYSVSYKHSFQMGSFINKEISNGELTVAQDISYNAKMQQIFHNVKYMDIVECHLYRLHKGLVKGLGNVLMHDQKTALAGNEEVLEMFCSTAGYKLYNADQTGNEGQSWVPEYTDVDGSTQGVWRAISAKDLEKCNRISNSFHENTGEYYSKLPDNGNNKHAFKLVKDEGDTMTFEYDIGTQGGRSHHCIDGFILQALACTFYKTPYKDSAVRNYIAVQGDYVTLSDPNKKLFTLCGMGYDTKNFVQFLSASDAKGFSILSCTNNKISSFRLNTAEGNGYYKIDEGNKDANSNKTDKTKGNITSHIRELQELCTYMDYNTTNQMSSFNKDTGQVKNGKYYGSFFLESSAYTTPLAKQYRDASKVKVNEQPEPKSWYTNFTGVFGADKLSGQVPAGAMPQVGYHGDTPVMRQSSFTYRPNKSSAAMNFETTKQPYESGAMDKLGHNFNKLCFYKDNLEESEGKVSAKPTGGVDVASLGANYATAEEVYFPFSTGLNIGRYKRNATYGGYTGSLDYDKCCGYDCTDKYMDILSVDINTGRDDSEGLHSSLPGDYNLPSNPVAGSAAEGQGVRTAITALNDIVVYNPSTAETAMIFNNGGELTDGKCEGSYGSNDQRINTQYVKSDNETYINAGNSISDSSIELPNSYDYKLRETSSMNTAPYTVDDFDNSYNDVTTVGVGAGYEFVAEKDDVYDLVLYGNNGSQVNQMTLNMSKGDTLKSDGTVVKLQRNKLTKPELSYETIKAAYEEFKTAELKALWDSKKHEPDEVFEPYEVTTDYIPITKNTTLTFDLGGLHLQSGDVVKMNLAFDSVVQPTATFSCSDMGGFELHSKSEGTKWTWYLEATKDNNLGKLDLSFNADTSLQKFDGTCFDFGEIFIMNNDSVNSGSAVHCSSYDWETSFVEASSGKFYNSYAGVQIDKTIKVNAKLIANTLYIINTLPKLNYKLSVLNNPHKVDNANWRYHVIGWRTINGTKITTPTSELLNEDTTILVMPESGVQISIKDIKDLGCLVKVNDKIYFTTISDGLNHKITETGMELTGDDVHFDYIDIYNPMPETVRAFNGDNYPLEAGQDYWEQDGAEFFIKCSDSDKPIYDVHKATNLKYRYPSNNIGKYDGVHENWTLDWERVPSETLVYTVINGITVSSGNVVNVQLDDLFQLYWDNSVSVNHTGGTALYGSLGVSTTLGPGWDNNFMNRGKDDGESDYYVYLPDARKECTETTKWIAEKFVTFDKPVYVFACPYCKKANPTLSPKSIGAKCHDCGADIMSLDIKLVPAGTKIDLGYTDETFNATNDSDNTGHFTDYGAPGTTYGSQPYLYTFWAALGGGEATAATAKCETININGKGGEGVNTNRTQNNYNAPTNTTSRFTNAVKNLKYTITGRIGALTVVESTDPRYSDTFKFAGDVKDYLIYPLIRQIYNYSNLEAVHGGQHRYLLDPFDVRGRIAAKDMLQVVSGNSNQNIAGKYSSYNVYNLPTAKSDKVVSSNSAKRSHPGEYNTYNTQWFKGAHNFKENNSDDHKSVMHKDSDTGDTMITLPERSALPLTAEFNSHKELKLIPLRIGYDLYCSLESIGCYYGDSHLDLSADDDPNLKEVSTNAAGDYNNRKVQIRPRYYWVPKNAGDDAKMTPVDVYMNTPDGYKMINTGSNKPKDFLRLLSLNRFVCSVPVNQGKSETDLDQEMLRRMVTGSEAVVTKDVLDAINDTSISGNVAEGLNKDSKWLSMLTPTSDDGANSILGSTDLNPTYTYGNAQFLFLREKNRTFVGGATAALENKDADIEEFGTGTKFNANKAPSWEMNAQKWYFGLGLPSSSKFVKTGDSFSSDNILKEGYIIVTVDVIINGSYWTLQYKSDVARMNLTINNKNFSWEYFNDENTWNIPVTYYDLSDYTSSADLDTEGSH